jgi:drug/metabolite transporter (DMT)-like permease
VIHLVMFFHTAISAVTYIAVKRALLEMSVFELALVRFVGAALVYLVLLAWRRVPIARRDVGPLCALGVVAVPLNQGLLLSGLARSTPGHAALLYALTPIFVFLIARARLGERVSPGKMAGIALALAGVVVVLTSRAMLSFDPGTSLSGDLMILGAVLSWSFYAVAGKVYAQRYGAVVATGYALVFGALVYLPFGLAVSDFHHFAAVPPIAWASVAYLILVTSVIAYAIYYWALARAPAGRIAIWANLQPVFTALLAWVAYGDRLTTPFLTGGAMVLAGVVLTERL